MQLTLSAHHPLTISTLLEYHQHPFEILIDDFSISKVQQAFDYLTKKLDTSNTPFYGINTGFGSLHTIKIKDDQIAQLQVNLIKSHACGTGKEIPKEITKWILLSKIQNLILGHSGVHINTLNRLIEMFNKAIYPVIYQQGSLGASGDLAPLAHLSLPLIGSGEVYFQNERIPTEVLYKKLNWDALQLHPKEGLALLNGTQYMSGIGIYLLLHTIPLFTTANIIASISLDAFHCRPEPFHPAIHTIRHHKGQIYVANQINKILKDSPSFHSLENKYVQDPYSFRCIPQIHGASYDLILFFKQIIETEINSVTDNPLIFPEQDSILSGGNFHGQILSNAFDTLALALNQLSSVSERRIYQLISGSRNLPVFLVKNPGVNSGFMITQYTAASIVNRNKLLCTPASADSIVSSNGQEDYVSMGANAANKCIEIYENVKDIIAIEFFTAVQALEFRRPQKSSAFIESIVSEYRKRVPFIEQDTEMYPFIAETKRFIEEKMFEWHFALNNNSADHD